MRRQMETAFQFIKEKILDGSYKPSQKLIESELSQTIGVSRNTIKKALLKLEQENLVKIEENKGATIKSFTLEEVVHYLEIREVLEGLVAKTAALHLQDSGLDKLENILQKMEMKLQSNELEEYSSFNRQFHQVIYDSSPNVPAVQMINMIKTQLLRYHFRTVLVPGRSEQSIKEHKAIFEALKAHDGQMAEQAVKLHISHVRETIEKNFSYLI